jgi:hypothetical protein
MDAPPSDGDSQQVSRRRLLRLAGTAGLAATVGAAAMVTVTQPPATVTAAPPTEATRSEPLLCRAAWGAKPPLPGGRNHQINQMTVHHSAAFLGDNRNIIDRLQQHQRYHQDTQNWPDIAYHISVDRNGNIFQLRSLDLAGDTATDYDTEGHFLVLCEGNFDEEEVSEAQLDGAAIAFAWAAQRYQIPTDTLRSHREVAPGQTSCPGANLQNFVTNGDLKRRVDGFIAAGPVDLTELCGPAADQIVANIKAGG